MDRRSVYTSHVLESNYSETEDTNLQVQAQLEAFILDFRLDNIFIYRYGTLSSMLSTEAYLTCSIATS